MNDKFVPLAANIVENLYTKAASEKATDNTDENGAVSVTAGENRDGSAGNEAFEGTENSLPTNNQQSSNN